MGWIAGAPRSFSYSLGTTKTNARIFGVSVVAVS